MDPERYKQVSLNEFETLTDEEEAEGWHFCYVHDWDLVGPMMDQWEDCRCFSDETKFKYFMTYLRGVKQ